MGRPVPPETTKKDLAALSTAVHRCSSRTLVGQEDAGGLQAVNMTPVGMRMREAWGSVFERLSQQHGDPSTCGSTCFSATRYSETG